MARWQLAILPEAAQEFADLGEADSIAMDPHKWLYAPFEAGCALVRDREKLRDAFSYHPPYYHFETEAIDLLDLRREFARLSSVEGMAGAAAGGPRRLCADDLGRYSPGGRTLSGSLRKLRNWKALTQGLSITTFRFIPRDLERGSRTIEGYLDQLNNELLTRLQNSGKAYLSNAIVRGRFALRAHALLTSARRRPILRRCPPLVVRIGEKNDAELRPAGLRQ